MLELIIFCVGWVLGMTFMHILYEKGDAKNIYAFGKADEKEICRLIEKSICK